MGSCPSYKLWHDKNSGRTFLKGTQGKCLHYYIDVKKIHKRLDEIAKKYCPVHSHFGQVYHWSIMQVEYATDIVLKK